MYETSEDRQAARRQRRIAAGHGTACHKCGGATGSSVWFDGTDTFCDPCGYASWAVDRPNAHSARDCHWCGVGVQSLSRRPVSYCSAYCRERHARSSTRRGKACLNCGNEFFPARKTAKFCCDLCRLRYSRCKVRYRVDVQRTYRSVETFQGKVTHKPGDTELTAGTVLWGTQEAAQRKATAATKHSPASGMVLPAYDDAGVVVEVAAKEKSQPTSEDAARSL